MRARVRMRFAWTLLVATRVAVADPLPTDGKRASFHANQVDLEPGKDRLELDGDVVVSVDRYRLTSDHLSLERGPRGIVVTGNGRVALCPCPDPPVAFGFTAATVAPPTDLLIQSPTVRVFGAPVFWLPYLWLRAPTRVGVTPLRLAYRGDDGFFAGSGVHLPLGENRELDVLGGGYFTGGAEVEGRLVTPRTTTDVRWDHRDQTALGVDLRGSSVPARGGSVAWSVDALRGARALHGPSLVEEVSQRSDRAAAFAGYVGDGAILGFTGTAVAARGGAISRMDAAGPGASAGFGAALASGASVDGDVAVTTLASPADGTTTLLRERTELRGDTRVGPVTVSAEARTRTLLTLTTNDTGRNAILGGGVELAVPVVKTFGAATSPLAHWVTPFFETKGGVSDTTSASIAPPIAADGVFYVAASGVRTSLGETAGAHGAVTVSAKAGVVGERAERPRPLLAWSSRGGERLFAISAEGVLAPNGAADHFIRGAARVGLDGGPTLGVHGVGSRGDLPLESRLLASGWDAPLSPYLSLPGWSVGGRAGIPLARWLATAVDVDYDVTNDRWLSVRGTLGYRHPCGCLAVALWGGHRLGRPGVDSFLTVDLAR